ncbi:TetR/AcrR family transcriptional regulator [Virgibacillus halophilus]|uniref:TetR/AcrR family transcriptional regulator n=1 Tax=Tigheibacillus halophilus TaxID=361280 RepID=A0ABU5C760_9BACI|nr:TetR/AcrR family transcriptional regulator [Virgibacillus halophilus]
MPKKAGVSQVSIYNYFGSKQQLANEVVIYYIDQEWMKYEQLIHSDLPFPDKIQQIVFDKKRLADEINENFYTYLMNEYVAGGYIKQIYNEKAVPLFTELLQEGKVRGFVDENLSSEAMLLYLQMLNESMQKKRNL